VNTYSIADNFEEAFFHDRPNRFTMVLKSGTKTIRAYMPNTGRLEEYLVEESPFYVVPFSSPKFRYRIVSTRYQGHFVLLDTILMNRLAAVCMEQGRFPWIGEYSCIKREKTMGSSRFDFCIERRGLPPLIVEVKTCTLIHRGIAMFPDAPSPRALTHMKHMENMIEQGFQALMLFMLPSGGARLFRPNHHTDPAFSKQAAGGGRVTLRAVSMDLMDPVTIDMDSVREIPVDLGHGAAENRGSYMLVLYNSRGRTVEVGKLGPVNFRKGYYVYVGSALNSLKSRMGRHGRRIKRPFWHIDYITPTPLTPAKSYAIYRTDRIEQALAGRVAAIAEEAVQGFGASDSRAPSHLFYFTSPPFRSSRFMDIVLDFRMEAE
jgi:sugar fermentation stimulation protein A